MHKVIDIVLFFILTVLVVFNLVVSMRLYNHDKEIEYITKTVTSTHDKQKELETELNKQKRIISQDLQIINNGGFYER